MAAGTWSSYARLQALNPHATFAYSPDQPKGKNPLLAADANATHIHTTTALDFTRTIPLSELIQADHHGGRRSRSNGGTSSPAAAATGSPLSRTTGRVGSASGLLPSSSFSPSPSMTPSFRIPQSDSYTASLEAVHAARADRMIRQPKGWSQAEANAKRQRAREEKGERIHIYQPGVHEALLAESSTVGGRVSSTSSPHRKRPSFLPSSSSSSQASMLEVDPSLASLGSVASTAISAALNPKLRSQEKLDATAKKMREFWTDVEQEKLRLHTKLRERIARNQAKDEKKFLDMMSRLNENSELLQEIDDYLTLHASDSQRKKDELYQRWCVEIFGPIQDMISKGLSKRSTSEVEQRRRSAFESFLTISNKKKRGLYNDVILEEDYNPLELREHVLKIHTGHLSDPLKQRWEEEEEEWRLRKSFEPIMDGEGGESLSNQTRIHHQVKHMLAPPIWAKYKIESTPHGRYSLLKGNHLAPVGKKLVTPSQSYTSEFTTSNSLDHYHIDTSQYPVRQQFFGRGKRVEGYDVCAEKVDYNILASTEPSLKVQYGGGGNGTPKKSHSSSSSSSSFPTHPVPLSPSYPLPPIAQSSPTPPPPQRATFVESKEEERA